MLPRYSPQAYPNSTAVFALHTTHSTPSSQLQLTRRQLGYGAYTGACSLQGGRKRGLQRIRKPVERERGGVVSSVASLAGSWEGREVAPLPKTGCWPSALLCVVP